MHFGRNAIAGTKTLTRAELFEIVWNEPMRTLAPKFGLSDVGLAKLCRRVGVPLPPMGYWARSERKRRRPKLPPTPENQSETVEIIPSEIRKVDVTSDIPKDIADLIASLNQASDVAVPATCPRSYAMFEKWDASVQRDPWLSDRRPSLSPIEKRRRRILCALAHEIENWKGRLIALDEHRFKVEFGKDDSEFTLREPSNQIHRPLTEQEKRWWPNQASVFDLKPSGKLRLLIESYFDRPIQKSWVDLESKPLENRLRDALIGLLIALSEDRRRRLKREEEECLWMLREQERLAAEERRRAEAAKLQKLKDDAVAWVKANQIRQYIAARLKKVHRHGESLTDVQAWAAWAGEVANAIDPLMSTNSSS
jgi:hypothetical protein